jgi:hypothetical protein
MSNIAEKQVRVGVTLYVVASTDEIPTIMEPHKASELTYATTGFLKL